MSTTEKKLTPIQMWKAKTDLDTKTILVHGTNLTFREMSGKEKQNLSKISNDSKIMFFMWDRCINSQNDPNWNLLEEELTSLYEKNSKDISAIMHQVMHFNGMAEEAIELLEKN